MFRVSFGGGGGGGGGGGWTCGLGPGWTCGLGTALSCVGIASCKADEAQAHLQFLGVLLLVFWLKSGKAHPSLFDFFLL